MANLCWDDSGKLYSAGGFAVRERTTFECRYISDIDGFEHY